MWGTFVVEYEEGITEMHVIPVVDEEDAEPMHPHIVDTECPCHPTYDKGIWVHNQIN